jgi:hypothetical protein
MPWHKTGKVGLSWMMRKKVQLKRGDVLVQNGTRHAWRNQANGFLGVRHPSSCTPTGIMTEGTNAKYLM